MPILVINKVDRPDARSHQVVDETFDLFCELNATDEQLDFAVVYCSAKDGVAWHEIDDESDSLKPLFETIIRRGYDVLDVNGDEVGKVTDMVVKTDTGMVGHLLIGKGWLDSLITGREVFVPFDHITVDSANKKVKLDIPRDRLKEFPEWKDLREEGLAERISNWWQSMRRAA